MKSNHKVINVLNRLIQMNSERESGYERAAQVIQDIYSIELKTLFYQLAEESRDNKDDLIDAVLSLGGEPQDDYREQKASTTWRDVETAFAGGDLYNVLRACETEEDGVLEAYREALTSNVTMPSDISTLIAEQSQMIRASHNRVKRYRDEYKTVDNTLKH